MDNTFYFYVHGEIVRIKAKDKQEAIDYLKASCCDDFEFIGYAPD